MIVMTDPSDQLTPNRGVVWSSGVKSEITAESETPAVENAVDATNEQLR